MARRVRGVGLGAAGVRDGAGATTEGATVGSVDAGADPASTGDDSSDDDNGGKKLLLIIVGGLAIGTVAGIVVRGRRARK